MKKENILVDTAGMGNLGFKIFPGGGYCSCLEPGTRVFLLCVIIHSSISFTQVQWVVGNAKDATLRPRRYMLSYINR